jgi:hypothetical protein
VSEEQRKATSEVVSEEAVGQVLRFPDSMHTCAGCGEPTLEPGFFCENCKPTATYYSDRYAEWQKKQREPITMNDICAQQETVECGVGPLPSSAMRRLVWGSILALGLLTWTCIARLVALRLHHVWLHSF